jgi:hypothetical protein
VELLNGDDRGSGERRPRLSSRTFTATTLAKQRAIVVRGSAVGACLPVAATSLGAVVQGVGQTPG